MHLGRFDLQEKELAMAGVHAALLHTGQVLFFSYDPEAENTLERGFWQLWDPATGPVTDQANVHTRNFFCAGQCFLPDGRLLVSGGQSYNWFPFVKQGADHDVHTYDPEEESWERHADMPGARWYPTCTALPDGTAIMAGGHATRFRPFGAINDDYEIFDPRTNTKGTPHAFNPGHVDTYPFMCVLPGGTAAGALFVYSRDQARLFSLASQIWHPKIFRTRLEKRRTYDKQGSFALLPLVPDGDPATGRVTYRDARVIVFGGEGEWEDATATAEIFEFDPRVPGDSRWRAPAGGDMNFKRFMSDAVLLPDGTVLIVNGAGKGKADSSENPVMDAELFDPSTETFTKLAQQKRPRMYHSSALLLPDARVVVAGNTEHWNPNNEHEETTVEIFTPPYLMKSGGRPQITAAPAQAHYGVELEITVGGDPANIASVVLLRNGSTTHTNNMDQRAVGLFVLRRTATALVVKSPPDATVAPPGYYMLFVVDQRGVPSVAPFIHLAGLDREVSCVRKSGSRVTAIGGVTEEGLQWTLSVEDAIRAIRSGEQSFYVEKPAGQRVNVIVARTATVRRPKGGTVPGREYLKTQTDGVVPNNLLALPICP